MYIFKDFNLLLFSRPTNVTKVLVFFQKWPIFVRLGKGKKSVVSGRKKREKGGENLREVG
jgi:hypothetical protein